MNKLYSIILLIILPFLLGSVKEPCSGYHGYSSCQPDNSRGFSVHGLSRSAMLEVGVPSSFEIDLYGGKDYIVTCCTANRYYPMELKIFKDSDSLMYTNCYDNYTESIGFTLDSTCTVRIELTVLAEKILPKHFDENRACAGVLVMYRRTPKLGF